MMKSFSFKKVALSALMVGAMGVQAHAPEGLYGGVQVGVDANSHVFRFYSAGPGGAYQDYELGSAGPRAGISAGYQEHFYESNWLWGVDISATYGREMADYYRVEVGIRDAIQRTWDVTSTLKVGYDAGVVSPYVFGGVSFGRFKTLVQSDLVTPARIKKAFKPGFVGGLGVSTVLCAGQELDFRYAYKRYGKVRGVPTNPAGASYFARFRSHEFLLTYKVFLEKDGNGMKHEMPAFDPEGFVWGLGAGYQSLNVRVSQVQGGLAPILVKAQGSSPFVDMRVGYQTKVDDFVLGADLGASYAFMGIKMHNHQPVGGAVSFRATRLTWEGRALARIGYQFGEGMIPYVTAGLAYGRFKASSFNAPVDYTLYGSTHKWRTGLVLGAGVQLPVSEKDSLDLSYTYARYKKLSFTALGGVANPAAPATSDYKPRTHRFLVSYRMKL